MCVRINEKISWNQSLCNYITSTAVNSLEFAPVSTPLILQQGSNVFFFFFQLSSVSDEPYCPVQSDRFSTPQLPLLASVLLSPTIQVKTWLLPFRLWWGHFKVWWWWRGGKEEEIKLFSFLLSIVNRYLRFPQMRRLGTSQKEDSEGRHCKYVGWWIPCGLGGRVR